MTNPTASTSGAHASKIALRFRAEAVAGNCLAAIPDRVPVPALISMYKFSSAALLRGRCLRQACKREGNHVSPQTPPLGGTCASRPMATPPRCSGCCRRGPTTPERFNPFGIGRRLSRRLRGLLQLVYQPLCRTTAAALRTRRGTHSGLSAARSGTQGSLASSATLGWLIERLRRSRSHEPQKFRTPCRRRRDTANRPDLQRAEGVGFEPTVPFTARSISSRVP